MAERKVYHVTKREDSQGWQAKVEGAERAKGYMAEDSIGEVVKKSQRLWSVACRSRGMIPADSE